MKKVLKNILYVIIFFIGVLMNYSFAETVSANIPVVVTGLTPIKYESGTWVTTTNMDPNWYDYENGLWANATTANGYKYVWIPRFTYKIEDETISIKWSDGKNDDTSDGYLRHPAFYFGEYTGGDTNLNSNFIERNGTRNEISGFWLQKDLFSSDVSSVSSAFDSAIKMTQNSAYGLPQSGTYTHMTKASEWGALAYLTVAKGRLTGSRTTINQTGVVLGTVSEYVAGMKGNPTTEVDILSSNYKKYRDLIDGDIDEYYGYALSETKNLASTSGHLSEDSFLVRGGSLGLFGYESDDGGSGEGYRTSISIITEELTDTIAFFDTEASVVAGDYLILGVDFYVEESWSFPENPSSFFVSSENAENKKVIDIECIYEGSATWHQSDLNAQVIKMIKSDLSLVDVESISSSDEYVPGKYTLVVRVGGKDADDNPVFRPMDNMDVKIIVNQLNLKNSDGDLIKIDKIPNNKVRLNVYGESASNVITKVVLKSVPTKTDYELEEELNLSGGIIVPYLGSLAGEEISLTIDNVVAQDITYTSGEHKVELKYNEMDVTQEEGNEFIITVSDTKQLIVEGQVKVGENIINSQFTGPGKYSRKETNSTQDLVASQYLTAYKFNKWTSDSQYVKAADSSDYSTTFTVPKKSTTIDTNEVTITANYVAPSGMSINNPKDEFIVGDEFSVGENPIIVTYPDDDNTESERQISLNTSGVEVTIKDEDGNEVELDNLPEGFLDVTIEFGDEIIEYEIEVIKSKHWLNVGIPSADCGDVSGYIKDTKGNQENTITIEDDVTYVSKEVAYGHIVTLKAEAKENYVFAGWKITGVENLVSENSLTLEEISFSMPSSNITVEAEFTKAYTITFKIQSGQESMGKLSGETNQYVYLGKSTSPVFAVPNTNYGFLKWLDSEGRLISQEQELVCSYVTKDEVYTAVFDNVWTVDFYNEDTLFKSIKVINGTSAHITEIPTKYAYVFTGWDKDLSSITSNVTTYAQYVPRINIEENTNYAENTIDAQITATMIEEGTLQYIISSSIETPEDQYFSYKTEGMFTGMEGTWYNLEEYYRSAKLNSAEDSSSLITVTSSNSTELIKFDYMLSVAADSQLGITINGERVIGPDASISSEWTSFEQEVDVVNGEIKIGISYSQDDSGNGASDFAAIRNLMVERKWITIPNSYHLVIPVEFSQNYIHVKGIGSDDLTTVYRAVSDVFISTGTILKSYTVTFNSSGGSGSMTPQTFTEGISQELTANGFTKDGYEFVGWASVPGDVAEYANKASYIATSDKLLYAIWKEESTEKYVITAISHEGAILQGVYTNHVCSVCGGTDHECEVTNVFIDASNSVVTE